MASNSFGTHFRFTTWGESHGLAIGVVIDGCPAGLPLEVSHIAEALARRAPGRSPYTSPRREPDVPEILSGLFEGKTLGTPISVLIRNQDVDSSKYSKLYRPGHAERTYDAKYGHYDYRGGGRASARETAGRVVAGAVAARLLADHNIEVSARLLSPTPEQIEQVMGEGDSIGGIVEIEARGLPPGLGDPVYQKLESELAAAILSINACKGFELGAGFAHAHKRGSENPHADGILGGISNGDPVVARAVFKPTSSTRLTTPAGSRHDPCVAVRAVPVCEAMFAVVLADRLLLNHLARHAPDRSLR